jgi:hypothetical protein
MMQIPSLTPKIKVIFKRKNYDTSNLNIQELIENIKNLVLSSKTEEFFNFYSNIYNKIYILSISNNSNDLNLLIDSLIIFIKNHIESKLQEINKNYQKSDEEIVNEFISIYKYSEKLVEQIRDLLTNNKTRFDKDLIFKMSLFNHKGILLQYINTQGSDIKNKIKNCISKDEGSEYSIKSDEFIKSTLKFIQSIGATKLLYEIIEIQKSKLIEKYQKLSEVEFTKCTDDEKLFNYLTFYMEEIQNTCFNFKILFGEHNANTLQDKLMDVMLTSKLHHILSNQSQMDNLIKNKNFSILHLIYNLMNKRTESLISFQEKFFSFYVEKFYSDMKIPNGIKEGLQYIDFLINRIENLNEVFSNCFNKDRRIQLRFKETLLRMINNKNVKNMYMLCGVYINEIMSRNNSVNSFGHLEKLINNFKIVLQSLDEANIENFFLTIQKFCIKRISNFKFNEKHEFFLIKSLREVFGVRHCYGIYRLLDDVKKSEEFFDKLNLQYEGKVYLFSFNAINKNDLIPVVDIINFPSPFNNIYSLIYSSYKNVYTHREVTFSQNLSTVILIYNKKYELLTNFIQLCILNLCQSRKTGIKLEEITSTLNVKNIATFRMNLISLITSGLIKIINRAASSDLDILNSDVIQLNFNFSIKEDSMNINIRPFINLTNIVVPQSDSNLLKKKDSLTLSRDHTSQSDIHALENSMESQQSIYISNKVYITDTKLMKIIKNSHLNTIEHNLLFKTFIKEVKHYYGENSMPDQVFIGKRLEALIERSLIKREIKDNIITYSFI